MNVGALSGFGKGQNRVSDYGRIYALGSATSVILDPTRFRVYSKTIAAATTFRLRNVPLDRPSSVELLLTNLGAFSTTWLYDPTDTSVIWPEVTPVFEASGLTWVTLFVWPDNQIVKVFGFYKQVF